MPGSEAARALSEVSHLRQVVRHLRGLLVAAVLADRLAEEAAPGGGAPPPAPHP